MRRMKLITLTAIALAICAFAPQVRNTFAASSLSEAATEDQCANGKVGSPVPCNQTDPKDWQNGDLNSNNSHYKEGDVNAFRAILTFGGVTAATQHGWSVLIQYDISKSGKSAYDYLTTFNTTDSSADPTAGVSGVSSANPGISAIPQDNSLNPCTGLTAGTVKIPVAASTGNMTLYGGTISSVTLVNNSTGPCPTGDTNKQIQVNFDLGSTSASQTLVLAWGAHIASELNWGIGNSAAYISGSPYHMALQQFGVPGSTTPVTIGQQDRAIQASAIIVTPQLVTTPSSSTISLGQSVTDTATLTSARSAKITGTVTFYVCSGATPCTSTNATQCSSTVSAPCQVGAPVTASPATVSSGSQSTATSASFTPTQAGTYCFNVVYSPDSTASSSYTGATDNATPGECFVVSQGSPTLVTKASETAGGVVGTSILSDSATLSGGGNPTGTITFTITAPNGSTTQVGSPVTVSGDGTYQPSTTVTATQVGTYTWHASYSGDANNKGAGDNGTNESLTTVKASPTITTQASSGGTVGSTTLSDSAKLTGSYNGTGTITFTLTQPDGTTVPEGSVTVAGDGTYNSPSVSATEVGTYTWHASYSGDSLNNGAVDNGSNESVATVKAGPLISTTASAGGVVGITSISDTANLSGGVSPTGTITFTLYNSNTCNSASQVFTGTVAVNNGNGSYPSGSYTPTAPGTYYWIASYSGDPDNLAVTTNCGDINESATITPSAPTITTTPSPASATLGTTPVTLKDSAVLAGGDTPTGTITFTLVGPGGTTVDTETATVSGNGTYTTPTGYTPTATGTYQWNASYGGDGNNSPVSETGSPSEQVTVSPASPAIVTTPSGAVVAGSGSALTDSATLSGGYNPTGTITFTLIGPGGATVDTETATVSGNGTYTTPTGYTPTVAGTYQWNASYGGDGNNSPVSETGSSSEQVTVSPASPKVVTNASETAGGVVGSAVLSDSATVSGGENPTGTITFTITAPNGSTTQVGSPVTVSGDGTYQPSTTVTATQVGTYTWHASYSGDLNNNGALDDGTNESLVTIKASPAVATSASETAGGVVGSAVLSDSATISGGDSPTGTLTFTLTAPDGTTAPEGSVTVTGDDTYNAPNTVTATEVGTYTWHASYSGDSLNNGAVDSGANESVTTVKASPSVATTLSKTSVATGTPVADSATLSGGATPTGSITFDVYLRSGGTATCTGTPTVLGPVTVSGNGTYSSPSFTTNTAGTYDWQAVYGGDGNNNSATSACGTETLVIQPALGKILPTGTTCGQFNSASFTLLNNIGYPISGTRIGQGVNPGVFFYYTEFTADGSTAYIHQSEVGSYTNPTPLFSPTQVVLYDSNCNTISTNNGPTQTGNGTIAVGGLTAGNTYIIAVKYSAKTVAGATVPAPSTVQYAFTTTDAATGGTTLDQNSNGLLLTPQ